ncbi:ATP-binding protein [Nocardioides salsibiostraticola]
MAQEVLARTGRRVAVDAVAALFGLTTFETDILVAAAVPELGLTAATGPVTFNRALAMLADPHWSALLPDSPLRGWGLLDLPDSIPGAEYGGLGELSLSVDERVLHALAGAQTLDNRLAGRAEIGVPVCEVSQEHGRSAADLARLVAPGPGLRPVLLTGEDQLTRRQVALLAATGLGFGLLVVCGDELPGHPAQADLLARMIAREAGLGHRLVLVESGDPATATAFADRSALVGVPVTVSSSTVPAGGRAGDLPGVPLTRTSAADRTRLLTETLAPLGLFATPDQVRRCADHLLTPSQIASAVDRAVRLSDEPETVGEQLATVCRSLATRPLHDLATVSPGRAGLDDLVLPAGAQRSLRAVVATVRQRSRVHGDWGYGERARGLAVTALFAGPSGTGKTMAAEALAHELRRDLMVVDLSQVVSKFYGETEKNLALLFAAAEAGSVLLFDEGDALFGRRTTVHTSHDRYANLEVAYLLQRLDTFDGIAILTTNARDNVDPAFIRRMRFVVTFPFPDPAQRSRLWSLAFPVGVPTDGLSYERLGQLAVSGGTITQLAVHAAFIAADEGSAVTMRHVLDAARIECDKLERPLAASEIKDWV